MERGEYQRAKTALDRAQRGVEILIHAHMRQGPQYDETIRDLRAANAALQSLLNNATSSQRTLATLDIPYFPVN